MISLWLERKANISTVKLSTVIEDLNYIKVTYNNKVVFDDTKDADGAEVAKSYKEFVNNYYDKIIYSITLKVVDFHHFEVIALGE